MVLTTAYFFLRKKIIDHTTFLKTCPRGVGGGNTPSSSTIIVACKMYKCYDCAENDTIIIWSAQLAWQPINSVQRRRRRVSYNVSCVCVCGHRYYYNVGSPIHDATEYDNNEKNTICSTCFFFIYYYYSCCVLKTFSFIK